MFAYESIQYAVTVCWLCRWVPPFSLAVFVLTLLMSAGFVLYTGHPMLMRAHIDFVPGMLAGVFWSLGRPSVYLRCRAFLLRPPIVAVDALCGL